MSGDNDGDEMMVAVYNCNDGGIVSMVARRKKMTTTTMTEEAPDAQYYQWKCGCECDTAAVTGLPSLCV